MYRRLSFSNYPFELKIEHPFNLLKDGNECCLLMISQQQR